LALGAGDAVRCKNYPTQITSSQKFN